ncbi:hypothetical protein PG997_010782 [Apiospora hydei]|uniref:Phosphatidylglycerol/phosphatidylinositol transfer protein n=1 Tax=Apiospora hydei TaxID=1337664 RepID=A0ABR1VKW5_9PEZI
MIAPSHLLLALASCIVVTGAVPLDGAPAQQQRPMALSTENSVGSLKVPGQSPAYHCSDPSEDLFQISRLDFTPQPRVGHYQEVQLYGNFVAAAATGDGVPWLNITATVNGRDLGTMVYMPLCDLNVFQKVSLPLPPGSDDDGHQTTPVEMHRTCPSGILKGYAEIGSPPMLLYPEFVPIGKWEVRAEAMTREGRRIFCVEGSFGFRYEEE